MIYSSSIISRKSLSWFEPTKSIYIPCFSQITGHKIYNVTYDINRYELKWRNWRGGVKTHFRWFTHHIEKGLKIELNRSMCNDHKSTIIMTINGVIKTTFFASQKRHWFNLTLKNINLTEYVTFLWIATPRKRKHKENTLIFVQLLFLVFLSRH